MDDKAMFNDDDLFVFENAKPKDVKEVADADKIAQAIENATGGDIEDEIEGIEGIEGKEGGNMVEKVAEPKKAGRPVGSPSNPKLKMLRQLKLIWSNSNNKASDVVAAANMYAELMGWKVKQSADKGTDILKIEFIQDTPPKPKNKMIDKVETKETK